MVTSQMLRVGALVVIASCTFIRTVRAQSAEAELLFGDGDKLMAAGQVAAACDAFEASNRIEARAGTLIRLGQCREQNHQLASAWSAYKDALARAKDPNKRRIAAGQLEAIEPRLSYLTVVVSDASRVDGLAITRNGKPLDRALWNRALPIDGGDYEITSAAAGYKAWRTRATVPAEGGKIVVEVGKLEPEASAAGAVEATASGHAAVPAAPGASAAGQAAAPSAAGQPAAPGASAAGQPAAPSAVGQAAAPSAVGQPAAPGASAAGQPAAPGPSAAGQPAAQPQPVAVAAMRDVAPVRPAPHARAPEPAAPEQRARFVDATRPGEMAKPAPHGRGVEPARPAVPAAKPVAGGSRSEPGDALAGTRPRSGLGGRRTLALGIAGLSGGALAAGVVLGLQAKAREQDAYALCPEPARCGDPAEANARIDQGRSKAMLANVSYGVAAACAISAAMLWFTGGAEAPARVGVAPRLGGAPGVDVLVRF